MEVRKVSVAGIGLKECYNDYWSKGIPLVFTDDRNIENVDPERFPLYRNATPITFTVGPGETLYIPFGMWHTAKSLEPAISVAFDLLNGRNFHIFRKDVRHFKRRNGFVKAVGATGYAAVGGALCKMGGVVGVKRVPDHI